MAQNTKSWRPYNIKGIMGNAWILKGQKHYKNYNNKNKWGHS